VGAKDLETDDMGMATLGWISGVAVIWSSLFAIGNFLYGRTALAATLTAIVAVSGLTLLYVINHLWDRDRKTTQRETEPVAVAEQ
jgi:hypothetical protein